MNKTLSLADEISHVLDLVNLVHVLDLVLDPLGVSTGNKAQELLWNPRGAEDVIWDQLFEIKRSLK